MAVNDQSIHPRVVGGVTVHQKVNTTKPKNKATIERAIRGIQGHVDRHVTDGMAQKRLAKLKELV